MSSGCAQALNHQLNKHTMKTITLVSIVVALLSAMATGVTAAEAPAVGQPAPDFSLPGSDGKTHKLAAYKGKQAVVLAWFPKAFTGG